MSDYLDPANEELLKDFFVEAELQVELLESNILVLENDPSNTDAVDELFRAAHTLKGGAATVQMDELAEFTHLVEDTLDVIRSGKARVVEATVDTLLAATDVIKAMLAERQAGGVYDQDVSALTDALKQILGGKTPIKDTSDAEAPAPAQPTGTAGRADVLSEYEQLELQEAAGEGEDVYVVQVMFREDNPMNTIGGIHLFSTLKNISTVLKTNPEFDELYEDVFHPTVTYYVAAGEPLENHRSKLEISDVVNQVIITELSETAPVTKQSEPTEPPDRKPAPEVTPPPVSDEDESDQDEPIVATEPDQPDESPLTERKRGRAAGSVLRVDSRRIDNLLNLVSETVINKAAFNQISTDFGENLSL